jgi:hypothetical protein
LISEVEKTNYFSRWLPNTGLNLIRQLQEEHVRLAAQQAKLAGDLSPWLRSDLGFLYVAQGDWEQAVDAWRPLSDQAPPRSPEARDRAYLTARQILASDVPLAELEKRVPHFQELLIERDRPPANNDRTQWRERLQKRMETDPADRFAARYLALALADELPLDKAQHRGRILAMIDDPRISPFTALAAAWCEHGKFDAAAALLRDDAPNSHKLDRLLRQDISNMIGAPTGKKP